jgi:hypothetical protein
MLTTEPEIDYFQLVRKAMATLGEHFRPSELAYLALTEEEIKVSATIS